MKKKIASLALALSLLTAVPTTAYAAYIAVEPSFGFKLTISIE